MGGPFVADAVMVGQSETVHRLPVEAPSAAEGPAVEVNPRLLIGSPVPLLFGKPRLPDALAQFQAHVFTVERTPAATLSFDGIATAGAVPPDPIGDVGPNHYVQMVNTRFAIFNKSGVLLSGPTNINMLFAGLGAGNQCVLNNDGDPVVLYDPLADRWLLSQFAVPGGPSGFHVCVAISQTPDPTGSYFLYDFAVPVLPDYFKIGVWPSGYYMATNDDAPGTVGVYALDRGRMLQGLSATFIRFVVTDTNLLLPSDLDGVRPPPAGAPNYFYTFTDPAFWGGGGGDRLDLFAFHADFATPGNSTFTALPSVSITAFNYTVCGYFVLNCIPQPSPGETVDPVSEWPMWRFAYRNMETHESLVGNFTVDVDGANQAGIRWFELRKSGAGNWTLFQEGTHAPDSNHRWMGSIAMDASGNIALGYSVSSSSVKPSLRYATRLAGAALGTLEAEAVLIDGTGVQTDGFNRWGDYSAMSVDPSDDCTFWYTGEYYATTSQASWRTRIGTFKIPSCTSTVTVTVTVSATDANAAEAGLDPGVFTVSRTGPTGSPLTVFYAMGGSATNGTDYQNLSGSVTIPAGQTSATITVTPIDDALVEGDETAVIQLQANAAYTLGTPNSATVTLADNDLPTVTVSATDANAAEAGLDPGVFTVSRTGPTGSALTVFYAMGGSATNGTDYQNLSGSVTIPAGQTSATITVTPIDDALVEGDETAVIQLQANAAYTLGTPNSATVTLADNDSASFVDVPPSHIFWTWIEALFKAGVTGGCSTSPLRYCPDAGVTRDQMAIFLLRGIHGAGYQPPPATGIFTDVPMTHPFVTWIEQLAREGITGGCSTSPPQYCPDAGVTRGQMAVFLLRAKHGATYQPPDATGLFTDVPGTHPFAKWIEQLAREGITGGCSTSPPQYCPDATVTRGQMAVFLVRAFNLPM